MSTEYQKPVVGADCHGCGLCVKVCKEGAISIKENNGHPRAVIDADKCKMHRECIAVCPCEAIGEPYPPAWGE